MNKLIVIGCLSNKTCYLNITKSEAIERYCTSENITIEEFHNENYIDYSEFEFTDEFYAYDAYNKE